MSDKPRWRVVTRVNQSVSVFEGTLKECRGHRNSGRAFAGRVRCSLEKSDGPYPDWATEVDSLIGD